MRHLLFVLAVLGALLSGWVPSLAAAISASQATADHTMHHAGHSDEDRGKGRQALHPVACAACFAIEAARIEAPARSTGRPMRLSFSMPRLDGVSAPPLEPPPRRAGFIA